MNYIKRDEQGITINGTTQIATGIRAYINQLCLHHGSTLEGRIASARYLLKRRLLVPIFVHQSICLIATTSIRDPNVIYLNIHQIAIIKANQDGAIVHFMDGSNCHIATNKDTILKQQRLAKTLLTSFSN